MKRAATCAPHGRGGSTRGSTAGGDAGEGDGRERDGREGGRVTEVLFIETATYI